MKLIMIISLLLSVPVFAESMFCTSSKLNMTIDDVQNPSDIIIELKHSSGKVVGDFKNYYYPILMCTGGCKRTRSSKGTISRYNTFPEVFTEIRGNHFFNYDTDEHWVEFELNPDDVIKLECGR